MLYGGNWVVDPVDMMRMHSHLVVTRLVGPSTNKRPSEEDNHHTGPGSNSWNVSCDFSNVWVWSNSSSCHFMCCVVWCFNSVYLGPIQLFSTLHYICCFTSKRIFSVIYRQFLQTGICPTFRHTSFSSGM